MHWALWCGVAMSLGWGLRGYIGGGPLGAMIPGALVALCLCVLLRREGADAARIAAWGAVGVGFGGQETYGQTIGLSLQGDTVLYGLAGLGLKGAVWGLLGGTAIGIALVRDQWKRRDLLIGLTLMVAGTWIGWFLIDNPKLLYFSNRLDKPREEVWAGLLTGGLLLLAWVTRQAPTRVPLRFAVYGTLGGGVGFYVGSVFQTLGRWYGPAWFPDWWKLMEFTFGFCFGYALGLCAFRFRDAIAEPVHNDEEHVWALPAAAVLALIAMNEAVPVRFDYTVAGAGLLWVTLFGCAASWQTAITMTFTCFAFDFVRNRPQGDLTALVVAAVAASIATAVYVWNRAGAWSMLTFLAVSSVADALLKGLAPGGKGRTPWLVLSTFVVLLILTLKMRKGPATHEASGALETTAKSL